MAEREIGTVKWCNASKGYGFPGEAGSGCICINSIRGEGYKTLKEGERVERTVIQGKKGAHAEDVSIVK